MTEILESLSPLVGQDINLFDRNGGPLNGHCKYIVDWWNVSNAFKLIKVFGPYIFIQSKSGEITKIKINLILEIQDKDLSLKI